VTTFSNNLWFPKVFFDAGLKVSEVPGWKTRGRRVLDIRGSMAHHTASAPGKNAPSLGTVVNGRSDLPGPLCQVLLGRDSTCYIVSAGSANHAGRGIWHGETDGNGRMFATEAENSGLGEPWPEKQLDAYIRLHAAVHKYRRIDAARACGHREYALPKGRKIDPTGIDMVQFRYRMRAIMEGLAPAPEPVDPGTKEQPTLRRGASVPAVEALQRALGLPVDGRFGPATEAALRAFQRQHDLVPDGICGPRTWAVIDEKGSST